MRASPRLPAVFLLLIALALPSLAHGGASSWSHDSHAPNPLYNPQYVGDVPDAAASDGAGGVFVFWEDLRSGNRDVYGGHFFADGSLDPAWYFGPGVCTAAGDQTSIRALPDGAGGVFVCWSDARSGVTKPYMTHLLANDSPAPGFPANGLGVETSLPNADGPPQMCLDAYGGVSMVWEYNAGAGNQDIYGAEVMGSSVAWVGGLVTTAASETSPVIASDSGTINMAWVVAGAIWVGRYFPNVGGPVSQIFSPSNATYTSSSPRIAPAASSGPGGSMVVWLTTNASGTAPAAAFYWAGSIYNNLGLIGAQVAGTSHLGDLIYSGSNSDWFVFAQGGPPQTLFAQQITPTSGGSPVLLTPKTDWTPSAAQICPDGVGGVIAAYNDVIGTEAVKAQRVMANNSIAPLWAPAASGGTMVMQSLYNMYVGAIASDGNSGAIVLGRDGFANPEMYVIRVDRWGALDGAAAIVSAGDVRNDQGGHVRLTWNASYLDLPYASGIGSYWIWRQLPASAAQARVRAGAPRFRAGAAGEPAPGTIRIDPAQAQSYAWEYLGSQVADGFPQYSYDAATAGDSTGAGNPLTMFMVEARSATLALGWPSLPQGGYSVDNLPPPAPTPFTGTYSSGTAYLSWGPVSVPDLAGYRLYRGTSASFQPGPTNLLSALTTTAFNDPAGMPFYYRITAIDVHGNESASTLLLPSGALGVDGGLPGRLALAPPVPNPARGSTTLAYAVPREGAVRLALYDVNGRLVRTLLDGVEPAGEHVVTWDLRDQAGRAVGSGLYLARFEAAGRVITRRVMAIR